MSEKVVTTIKFDDFKFSRDFFDLKISKKYYRFVFLVLAFIISFFIWMIVSNFDIVVKGNAVIRPKNEVSIIKIRNSGIVREKNYVNGSIVKTGDLLFSLDSDVIMSDIENTKLQILRNENKLDVLDKLKKIIESEEIPNEIDEASIRANIYFSEKNQKKLYFEKADMLYKNEIALPDALTYSQKIFELKNERDIAKADLDKFSADFMYSLLLENYTLQKEKADLAQKLKQLEEQLSQCEIIATKDGIVEELTTFSVGDLLGSGENIIRIVPLNSDNIKAFVNILEKDISDIKIGQEVKIKLSAFNEHEYGQIKGYVSRIGADTIYENNVPYYQIDIEIKDNTIKSKKGTLSYLRPGMTGIARIKVNQKKLMAYVLEKINLKD
ncbi:Multidrug resistance efflux pump [Treponema bryantii]|uniref:Multidrug resistance efflux pump n=1 Tax=Treponema bryantii TaxID=163 RepID=A0A1H9H1D9_9SPIR|nr:HlyD family efflux transporter periplasmic adaptor subunit [Treponema bryantii]SEQ56120.1 Multidrug resistance efflux pump [Treponema bryantii]